MSADNRNLLAGIERDLDEYASMLAEAQELVRKMKNSTRSHMINRGEMRRAQIAAYSQGITRMMTLERTLSLRLSDILKKKSVLKPED